MGSDLKSTRTRTSWRGTPRRSSPGCAFRSSPGSTLEGRFGVRIEDIVAVTEDGAVRLNDAPRELTVID